MQYPTEFILKVKLNVPTNQRLHAALDQGETTPVGRYLDDQSSVDPGCKFLYREWVQLYEAWCGRFKPLT